MSDDVMTHPSAAPRHRLVRLIPRPRLRAVLERALQRRVVLIVAPSGFGKTAAVHEALGSRVKAVWTALSPRDTSLARVAARAARGVAGVACGPPGPAAREASVEDACGEVAEAARACAGEALRLVFDGADASPISREICSLALRIVREAPQNLGIVITTTAMPAVGLEEWARTGQLAIIGRELLKFTPEEVAQVLTGWADAGGCAIDEAWRITSGWPRGVTALAAAYPSPLPAGEIRRGDLVWAFAPPEDDPLVSIGPIDRNLLLSLSLLPTIEPSDADLLTGVPGTHDRLPATAGAARCLIPLGAGRYTIEARMRDRLRAVLKVEWEQDRQNEQLTLVGRILKGRGQLDEALDAFLQAGEGEEASRVLGSIGFGRLLGRDPARLAPVVDRLAECRTVGREGRRLAAYVAMVRGVFGPCGPRGTGEPEEGERASREELDAVRQELSESGSWYPTLWDAWGLLRNGRVREAAHLVPSLRPASEGFQEGLWCVCRARIHWCRGEYTAARAALDGLAVTDGSFLALMREHSLAEIECLEGNPAALERAVRALELSGPLRATGIRRDLMGLAAICAAWQGDADTARTWVACAGAEGLQTSRIVHAAAVITGTSAPLMTVSAAQQRDAWWPWSELQRGFFLLREGEAQTAKEIFDHLATGARWSHAGHLSANATLCAARAADQLGDTPAAQSFLRRFWGATARHGFAFMPVSDAGMLLWAARAWDALPGRSPPARRLTAPLSAQPFSSAVSSGETAGLEIATLGPLAFSGEGVPSHDIWKTTRKAKRLFEILLSRPGLRVSADEAADALWPDGDPARVRHRLQNEVTNLRRVCAALGQKRLEIRVEHGFYRLYCADEVRITDRAFEALAQKGLVAAAEGRQDEAQSTLRAAVALYRGAFLEDARYEDFAARRREHLGALVRKSLHALARSPSVTAEEALVWWHKALELDAFDEEAYRGIVERSIDADRPAAARHYLNLMKARIVEELAVPIPDWAIRLSETLGSV